MTAIIHLTENQTATIENLVEVRANFNTGLGVKTFPASEINEFILSEKTKCTFVGEKSTLAFNASVIRFVEFKKRLIYSPEFYFYVEVTFPLVVFAYFFY